MATNIIKNPLNSKLTPFIKVIKVHDTWVTGKTSYFLVTNGTQVISFHLSNGTNLYHIYLEITISNNTITKDHEYISINGNAPQTTNYMIIKWA